MPHANKCFYSDDLRFWLPGGHLWEAHVTGFDPRHWGWVHCQTIVCTRLLDHPSMETRPTPLSVLSNKTNSLYRYYVKYTNINNSKVHTHSFLFACYLYGFCSSAVAWFYAYCSKRTDELTYPDLLHVLVSQRRQSFLSPI